MYKRHKVVVCILFTAMFLVALLFKADYYQIAESAIAVVSIALAVYIGAASVILGSSFAEKLKNQRDDKIRTKTSLGVLASYLRAAGFCSVVTIVVSVIYVIDLDFQFVCVFLKDWEHYESVTDAILLVLSSLSCSLFSVNIVFIWLILIFLINSMAKSTDSHSSVR